MADEVDVYNGADRPIAVPAEIVLAAQRPYRAYLAHQQGKPWNIIAVEENYPSASAARSDVRRYLEEGRVLVEDWTKAEMLAMEIARLNALQAAIWEGAMEGKIPAVSMARTLILDRVNLLKLDEQADENDLKARTVVVLGETEEDYIARLQEVAGDES